MDQIQRTIAEVFKWTQEEKGRSALKNEELKSMLYGFKKDPMKMCKDDFFTSSYEDYRGYLIHDCGIDSYKSMSLERQIKLCALYLKSFKRRDEEEIDLSLRLLEETEDKGEMPLEELAIEYMLDKCSATSIANRLVKAWLKGVVEKRVETNFDISVCQSYYDNGRCENFEE